jgi:hypothetical protein
MEFPKFILQKDWFLETELLGIKNKVLIYSTGQEIQSTPDGEYHLIWGGWTDQNPNVGGRMILSLEQMRSATDGGELIFKEIETNPIEIKISEISEEDEDIVRSWRIQLDVKTTRKKLKEVERAINDRILPLLN